jgi:hypothetical protein
MKEDEKTKEYEEFLTLIYSELEKIVENRPKNPVSNFAKR